MRKRDQKKVRSPDVRQGSRKSAHSISRAAFKATLILAERSLDGLPIPGAKGAIGGLLVVMNALEVHKKFT